MKKRERDEGREEWLVSSRERERDEKIFLTSTSTVSLYMFSETETEEERVVTLSLQSFGTPIKEKVTQREREKR